MSSLTVYSIDSPDLPNKLLTHAEDIASTLAVHNVRFEQWTANVRLQAGASEEDLLAAYQPQIAALMNQNGYLFVDVLSIDSAHPQLAELRAQHLRERRHGEDVARCFIAGRGLFSLHIEDHVYAVLCEKGDLIVIPAGIRHWFDLGEQPYLVMIRMFNTAEDWPANFTDDPLAGRFARLED